MASGEERGQGEGESGGGDGRQLRPQERPQRRPHQVLPTVRITQPITIDKNFCNNPCR